MVTFDEMLEEAGVLATTKTREIREALASSEVEIDALEAMAEVVAVSVMMTSAVERFMDTERAIGTPEIMILKLLEGAEEASNKLFVQLKKAGAAHIENLRAVDPELANIIEGLKNGTH